LRPLGQGLLPPRGTRSLDGRKPFNAKPATVLTGSRSCQAPNLAGQNEIYLVKALKDYRGGARKNEMMSLATANLTDRDIADLAAYYSAITITVRSPPK